MMASSQPAKATKAFPRWIAASFAVVLIVTGMAKLWSLSGDAKLLDYQDPIVNVPFRRLMLVAAVVELIIASLYWIRPWARLQAHAVAWLATLFLGYRIGLWYVGWQRPCACLGGLTDALHLEPEAANRIALALLSYLLIASYAVLIASFRGRSAVHLPVESAS